MDGGVESGVEFLETQMLRKAMELSKKVQDNSRLGWKDWTKQGRSLVVNRRMRSP